MSAIIVPSRRVWTRQPQSPAVINKNNRYGALCTFAWEASTNIDHARKRLGAVTLERRISSVFGIESAWSNGGITFSNPPPVVNEPFTVVACLTDRPPYDASGYFLGAAGYRGYGCSRDSNCIRFTLFGVASYDIACSAPADDTYPVALFAWVYTGSVFKGYRNGVYIGQSAVGTMITSGSGGDERVANSQGYQGWASRSVFSYRFRKAFTDAEVAEITARPRQIFARRDRRTIIDFGASGTTSVTSDSSPSYLVRNAINADLAAIFNVRGNAVADSANSYTVRTNATRDATASYSLRGLVQSDDAEVYKVRGLVQASDAEAYNIRGAVTADKTALYDIQSSTSVANSNAVNYSVRGAVTGDSSPSYAVRSQVQQDDSVSYSVRTSAYRDVVASYAVEAAESAVYADLTTSYSIDGVAPSCPSAESIASAVLAALQADPSTLTVPKFLGLK